MADETDTTVKPSQPTQNFTDERNEQDTVPVQFRFPTIQLHTSFESLLSHSASSQGTVIMSSSTGGRALDESWASLDTSDFSQDEDTQSEVADTGSLVDLSSAHDTESAVEEDIENEIPVEEEDDADDQAASIMTASLSDHKPQRRNTHSELSHILDDPSFDTVILERSQHQSQDHATDLFLTKALHLGPAQEEAAHETIRMTVAHQPLDAMEKPFKIAYYGATSACETKDELLGKLGAAILSASSQASSTKVSASPCFNIVPTEFGPGSKPAFADLVPSHAQMSVDDLTVLKRDLSKSSSIRFALKHGPVMESEMEGSIWTITAGTAWTWQPDLLVIHISQDDAAEKFATLEDVLEIARRHSWPVLAVKDERRQMDLPANLKPSICLDQHFDVGESSITLTQPIDLDTFIAMDTYQLNCHLSYLVHQSQEEPTHTMEALNFNSILGRLYEKVVSQPAELLASQIYLPAPEPTAPELEAKSVRTGSMRRNHSWRYEIRQLWTPTSIMQSVKDLFEVLIIIALGACVVYFLQNLMSFARGPSQGIRTISPSLETCSQATHAHTASPTKASSTSASVLSVDHDVVVYEPISFDHVWTRLTGRSLAEPGTEPSKRDVSASAIVKESVAPEQAENVEEGNPEKALVDMLPRKLKTMLNDAHDWTVHQRQERQWKLVEVQQVHSRLQKLWGDLTTNVREVSYQSQQYFDELLSRSQQHLRKSLEASSKRLDELLTEQKQLLARAQENARLLARQVPLPKQKKQRTWFFV